MRKQRGFTLIELIFVIIFFLAIAILGGLGYIAIHFIGKFW